MPRATFEPLTTTTSSLADVALLDELVIAAEGPRDGYERSLFAEGLDDDGDGCDTRCEALDGQRRTDLPGLPGGGWLSLYDGHSTADPNELEVDHVVALAEAWDSGAWAWEPQRRAGFANDIGGLQVVTAAMNQLKSDRDPAEWQPPNRAAWCAYAEQWVRIKAAWQLTVDEAEASALRNMLLGC